MIEHAVQDVVRLWWGGKSTGKDGPPSGRTGGSAQFSPESRIKVLMFDLQQRNPGQLDGGRREVRQNM